MLLRASALACAMLIAAPNSNAQFGKALKNAAAKALSGEKNENTAASQAAPAASSAAPAAAAGTARQALSSSKSGGENNGNVYYVSINRGSARGQGTQDSPMKDIQKAIDKAVDGDVVRVAEGNYLGTLERGWIEIKGKYITLEGGWSDDFSERNPVKYVTRMQPTEQQAGTINATNGMLYLDATSDAAMKKPLVVDGMFFDLGNLLTYQKAGDPDPRFGWPGEGVETGRVNQISLPPNPSIRAIGGKVCGKLIIRNCLFTNIAFHAIIVSQRGGEWEIYNNVFVSCHYAALDIAGGLNQSTSAHKSKVDFHHNTVAFSWPRDKTYEDMGYGYRYRNGVDHNVHHNIFACNTMAALDAGWDDSNLPADKKKVLIAEDNRFFMNRGDVSIAGSSGGKWIFVPAKRFDEVEQLTGYERNAELDANSSFVKAIDEPYLKGYAELKVVSSQSFDPNSAANTFRAAHGMNMQGTETVRVTMHGNRYNFEKAIKFFGAEVGFGAQMP